MTRFEKITVSSGWHLNKRPHTLPNHTDQPRFQLVPNPLVSIAEYRHQIRDGTELDEECIFKKSGRLATSREAFRVNRRELRVSSKAT